MFEGVVLGRAELGQADEDDLVGGRALVALGEHREHAAHLQVVDVDLASTHGHELRALAPVGGEEGVVGRAVGVLGLGRLGAEGADSRDEEGQRHDATADGEEAEQ
jgi:hypothetical protein